MKKITVLFFILAISGCANNNIITKEFNPEQIVHYSELRKLKETSSLNNCVVYLDRGDMLPLEISLDTDIIGIEDEKVNVVAKQKLFLMLKMPENLSKVELLELESLSKEQLSKMSEADKRKFYANFMLYISKDATEWAPISDIQSIKKVFGSKSKGGTISFGMGMTKKEGIWSYLGVKEVR